MIPGPAIYGPTFDLLGITWLLPGFHRFTVDSPAIAAANSTALPLAAMPRAEAPASAMKTRSVCRGHAASISAAIALAVRSDLGARRRADRTETRSCPPRAGSNEPVAANAVNTTRGASSQSLLDGDSVHASADEEVLQR